MIWKLVFIKDSSLSLYWSMSVNGPPGGVIYTGERGQMGTPTLGNPSCGDTTGWILYKSKEQFKDRLSVPGVLLYFWISIYIVLWDGQILVFAFDKYATAIGTVFRMRHKHIRHDIPS